MWGHMMAAAASTATPGSTGVSITNDQLRSVAAVLFVVWLVLWLVRAGERKVGRRR